MQTNKKNNNKKPIIYYDNKVLPKRKCFLNNNIIKKNKIYFSECDFNSHNVAILSSCLYKSLRPPSVKQTSPWSYGLSIFIFSFSLVPSLFDCRHFSDIIPANFFSSPVDRLAARLRTLPRGSPPL